MIEWFEKAIDFSNILNISITASWLILVVIGLRLILKKAPKWVNVALWGIVALRLLMPFSIESALSLVPSVETVSDQLLQAEPEYSHGEAQLDIITNPNYGSFVTMDLDDSMDSFQWSMVKMSLVWYAGIAAMSIYTLISFIILRRKLRTAVILRDNLFQCETVSSPFVLGILKPKIYLPYGMDDQNLSHVIAHEQAHIRRKDHWWKPLGFLLLTIHWFNPLMWVAYILLCRDIELACDEKVIAELENEKRADYTQALVACAVNRHMIAACPLAFGEVGVKDRVKSIMNYRKPTFWIIVTALVVCVVVAVCFLTDPKSKSNGPEYEHFYSYIGQQVKVARGFTEDGDMGSSIRISFHSSSGPKEFSVVILYRVGEQKGWTSTLPTTMNISSSTACNLPAGCEYIVMATLLEGEKGNASFMVDTSQKNNVKKIIYFSSDEFDDVTEMKLRNLHNGADTTITDQEEIDLIADFISRVQGTNPMSSKGYYGGSYEIQMYNGTEKVFGIGFGDDESFNYGKNSDGYPMRYTLEGVTREDVIRFFSQFDSSGFDWGLSAYKFHAKILEINEGYFLVEPVAGSLELNCSDKIEVPIKHMSSSPEPQVGDILQIEYDGMIQELYPAKIPNVYQITLEVVAGSD